MSLRTSEHAELPNTAQEKCIFSNSLQIHHACQGFGKVTKTLGLYYFLQRPEFLAPATQNAVETSKSSPNPSVFTLLTSEVHPRHSAVLFLIISISKSGSNPSVFYTFDLQIGSTPQRRAIFDSLTFQKLLRHASF